MISNVCLWDWSKNSAWYETAERFIADVKNIKIIADYDGFQLRQVISKLDELDDGISYYARTTEDLYSNINELVDIILKSSDEGSNERARMASARAICENYTILLEGQERTINLIALRQNLRSLYKMFRQVMEQLERKHSRLMLVSSLIRSESVVLR